MLVNNCYNCHSANTNSKGGLRVDDRNGLLEGGGRGPAVVPGKPEKSLLIQAVRQTHAMVQDAAQEAADRRGNRRPDQMDQGRCRLAGSGAAQVVRQKRAKYEKLRQEHWAWQPLAM